MQELNDVTNFASSMFERFPQQIYATALFVLWCGMGLVSVAVARKRSAGLQGQIDELRREVHQLEAEDGRRAIEAINLRSRSGHHVHQEDASPIAPFSIITTVPAPPLAATARQEPEEQQDRHLP
jgi:hypothetical protein